MFHVLSVVILIISMMIVTFVSDNPLIVFSALVWSLILLIKNKEYRKIKLGLMLMIPMILVTGLINIILVDAGNKVLFTIFNKAVTLEILIYVLVTSMKLLVIIYLFNILGILLDTDKAVSYFSKRSPRITLIVLLCLKLVPNMKKRINSLKNTYMVRGLNLEATNKKEAVKSYIPVLSILLEDSLEKSFDIGESAYVRGFGSGKRSQYEKEKLLFRDYLIIIYFIGISTYHLLFYALGKIDYDVYGSDNLLRFINGYSILEVVIILVSLFLLIRESSIKRKEELYGTHKDR